MSPAFDVEDERWTNRSDRLSPPKDDETRDFVQKCNKIPGGGYIATIHRKMRQERVYTYGWEQGETGDIGWVVSVESVR